MFAHELGRLKRRAEIVAGPAVRKEDSAIVPLRVGARSEVNQQCTGLADHIDVSSLGSGTLTVTLSRRALLQDERQRRGVIIDVEPVTDICAPAVDGKGLTVEGLDNQVGNELFGKLPRPVIVGAVGDHNRQPERVIPGTHKMIGRCLGSRIGRTWIVARFLEERSRPLQRTKHFVGRHMVKAKSTCPIGRQLAKASQRRVKHDPRADHICLDEDTRIVVAMNDGSEYYFYGFMGESRNS